MPDARREAEGLPPDLDQVLPEVYAELKRIAGAHMRGERGAHTLQTTALANEAYLVLSRDRPEVVNDREHFLAIASRAIRRILVDHARRRGAQKRGAGLERIPLEEAALVLGDVDTDLLELDAALGELAGLDARKALVVELRFFGGMSHPEIARVLGAGLTTIEDDWYAARAWLRGRLA